MYMGSIYLVHTLYIYLSIEGRIFVPDRHGLGTARHETPKHFHTIQHRESVCAGTQGEFWEKNITKIYKWLAPYISYETIKNTG